MNCIFRKFLLLLISLAGATSLFAQLNIIPENNPQLLVQKLLGNGIIVTNIQFSAAPVATGFFVNESGPKISLDSGIVLTNGRAKTLGGNWGMDGNGISIASATQASTNNQMPGDADLAREIGVAVAETKDATILEFDFVPLGDTIKFKYVFSSEEYTPSYVCSYNDAFAFFISGPGIAGGVRNIALIPNTNTPVSIFNVNDVPGGACPNNRNYYIDNASNTFFTHDGHTTILTAIEKVIPCQTYHLKLVIADVSDSDFDSGVFLEAKSLSSNVISMHASTQLDPLNNAYLVEGCASGSINIQRPNPDNTPLDIHLSFAGTAVNGTDIQTIPAVVTIPANQTSVTININPIIDNLSEGIETLKIYALAGTTCGPTSPTDSAIIQLRDYDTLGITPHTAVVCNNSSIQLTASAGYSAYQWDANATLNNIAIRNPVATPVNANTIYYCTATEGTCHGRDSVVIPLKKLQFIAKTDVNCNNAATGSIQVSGGGLWSAPVWYSINNSPYQTDSTFNNLPVGVYSVKIKDADNCIDSLSISITQSFPTLMISGTGITAASCSGNADGTAVVNVTGGKAPYLFSADGINFQNSNTILLPSGNYLITVKDNNNCTASNNIILPLNNTVTLNAGTDPVICEGKSTILNVVSNAANYSWTPSTALNNSASKTPTTSTVSTTQYIVTATTGICQQKDTVTVFVNPAPAANAGPDKTICFAQTATLNGSGGIQYTWTPATYLNNPLIAAPSTGSLAIGISYALSVTDNNGCVSLKNDTVQITVLPQAVVYAGRDTTLAIGQPLKLSATDINNTGFTQYQWTPSYGLDNPFSASPITILDKEILYNVTASNSIGCAATDNIKIKVYRGPDIYVPNAFTPDGNGTNDILKAIPVGLREFHYFRIYNRWGNIVFSSTNPANGWDGKNAGAKPLADSYIWIAEGVDYKGNIIQRKGTVIIIQ